MGESMTSRDRIFMKKSTFHPPLPGFGRALFAHGWRLLAATLLMATGNGVWGAEPQITLSANQLNFPAQIQETASAQQLVVVTNSGQADLSITGISISRENIVDS